MLLKMKEKYFIKANRYQSLYIEYMNYMRNTRGLNPGTINNRKKPVLRFLIQNEKHKTVSGINKLKPAALQDYVVKETQTFTREGKRSTIIALRDFFKFLFFEDYTKTDYSKSVPTITTYRLTTIHRGISWNVVKKLLTLPDRRTFTGKRDYALILMLARYGIRQGQLTELRLGDIDWKNQTIHFKAVKGGKDINVPLFEDVAEAILAYIKGGRKDAPKKYDQVFLTLGRGGSATCGQRPLQMSLWNQVDRMLNKLGIDKTFKSPRGPHAIRHAFATKLLEENEPIKSISDLMGHKSIRTTFIYTKSDINRLRKLSVAWPEKEVA